MHKLLQLLFILLLACSAFLTGCGSAVPITKPFKMDIQQGNVVTSKMLLQLKPGMSKSQVKFIMGSPLLIDSFHTNRWDYFYQMRQAGKIKEQRRVILEFENELLARVRGDVVPEGDASAASGIESGAVTLPKSVEPKPKEEGLLDKLKFWKKDETKPAVKPVAKVAVPAIEPKLEAASSDAPSVLVVPVPIGDAPSVPSVNLPEVAAPIIAEPKAEPVKVEPTKTDTPKIDPVKIEPLKVEQAKVEQIKVEQIKVEQIEPSKIESIKPVAPVKPAAIRPATSGEPFSFRIDRNLDVKNLQEAPIEVAPVEKPKKVDVAPPPPAEEPSYFEKMLEKIGF